MSERAEMAASAGLTSAQLAKAEDYSYRLAVKLIARGVSESEALEMAASAAMEYLHIRKEQA